MRTRILALALCAAAVSCGSGTEATVEGTVLGRGMQARGATWFVADDAPSPGSHLELTITEFSDMCGRPFGLKNVQALVVTAAVFADGAPRIPEGPGEHVVLPEGIEPDPNAGRLAKVYYLAADRHCGYWYALASEKGRVTFTAAGKGRYAGTFEVEMETGDRLRGSFDTQTTCTLGPSFYCL